MSMADIEGVELGLCRIMALGFWKIDYKQEIPDRKSVV